MQPQEKTKNLYNKMEWACAFGDVGPLIPFVDYRLNSFLFSKMEVWRIQEESNLKWLIKLDD